MEVRVKQVRAGGRRKGPERIPGRTFPGSVVVNSPEEPLGPRVIYMMRGRTEAQSIESDIPGTFQVYRVRPHNQVSIPDTSDVHFHCVGKSAVP